MTNYYLVESPLQLINAIEARYEFYSVESKNVLIVLEGVSMENLAQIQAVVHKRDWDEIHILKSTRNRWKYRNPIKRLNEILIENKHIGVVCIGEYRSILMRHFAAKSKSDQVYLLDDGNYSLFIQQNILNMQGEKKKYSFPRLIYDRLLGIQDDDLFRIDFFSVYSDNFTGKNKNRLIKNNYNHLKNRIANTESEDVVYFLGNVTPEMGILDNEYYMNCMEAVISYFRSKGISLLYIPHRREHKKKLDDLVNRFNIKIKNFNVPIEIAIVNNNFLPKAIASFHSSALDNCYNILGHSTKVFAFEIHPDQIKIDEYVRRIQLNYKTYESYDRNIFSIIPVKEYFQSRLLISD